MNKYEILDKVEDSTLWPAERLVMFVLAKLTDSATGEIPEIRQLSLAELAQKTGQSEATLKRALNVLESGDEKLERGGGWVIRSRASVADQRKKHEITRYRMAYDGEACGPYKTVKAGLTMSHAQPEAGLMTGPGVAHGEPSPGPTMSHKSKSFSAVNGFLKAASEPASIRIIIEALRDSACTVEEATLIVEEIQTKKRPKSLPGFLSKLAKDGDLVDYLNSSRELCRRAAVAHALAVAKTQPPCRHGNPGGDLLRPDTNEPICANCRHHARQAA